LAMLRNSGPFLLRPIPAAAIQVFKYSSRFGWQGTMALKHSPRQVRAHSARSLDQSPGHLLAKVGRVFGTGGTRQNTRHFMRPRERGGGKSRRKAGGCVGNREPESSAG